MLHLKNILSLFVLIFLNFYSSAQNFQWAKNLGGSGRDFGNSIIVDGKGNVYTTGYFSGTADFDPGSSTYNLTSKGTLDIFISKINSAGNFVWAKSMGGKVDEQGNSICLDALGNIYIAGSFNDTVDFDPGPGTVNLISAGRSDIFISKLDSSGNFIWAKGMGGKEIENCYSLAVDAVGNVYSTGFFNSSADFDPGVAKNNLSAIGKSEIFISKLNTQGTFVWAKKLGGLGNEEGKSIKVDSVGNVYTMGIFYETADFDPGSGIFSLTSNGSLDLFISKLDNSGNFIWAKSLGGMSVEVGYSLALASSGNIYITGYFIEKVDFDPGIDTAYMKPVGYRDVFILKLNSSGKFVWVKTMGGTTGEEAWSMVLDKSENIYTTGLYANTSDFDPNGGVFNLNYVGGTSDVFISKINSSGNFVWAKSIGGSGQDVANGIAIDISGNLYITGYFMGTADFDPGAGTHNITSNGDFEIFILKLSQTLGMSDVNIEKSFSFFPNPTNGQITILNFDKIETIEITDILGQIIYHARSNEKSVSLQHEKEGIYFVKVKSAGQTVVKKLLVKK